jgi:hypothetical protein
MTERDPVLGRALDLLVPAESVSDGQEWRQAWPRILDLAGAPKPRRRLSLSRRKAKIVALALALVTATALVGVIPALAGKGYFWAGGQPEFPHTGVTSQKHLVAVFHPKGHPPVVVTASPSKPGTLSGPGVCYLFSGLSSGCSTRSPHGSLGNWPSASDDLAYGMTFDPRVVAVAVTYSGGKRVNLPLVRAKPPISAAFFVGQAPPNPTSLVFQGRDGKTISRVTPTKRHA